MEPPSAARKLSLQDDAFSFLSEIESLITAFPGEDNRKLIFRALSHIPLTVSYVDCDLRYQWVHGPHPGTSLEGNGSSGRGWAEPDDLRELFDLKRKIIETGNGMRLVLPFVINGGLRYFDILLEPHVNIGGETIGVVTVSLDVTGRVLAEQALSESEERYRLAARATSDAIWDWDLTRDVIAWNQAAVDRFGWSEAINGTSFSWWKERVHPGDFEKVVSPIETFLSGTGDDWSEEYRFRRKDGTYASVLDRGYVLRGSHLEPVRFVGALLDLTRVREGEAELRQREEDLKRAQAIGNIGNWRLDMQRGQLCWSDETYRLFGIPKGTPMTYERFLGSIHPDDRDYVDQCWKAALEGAPYNIEHRILSGGEIRWVNERAFLEIDQDGVLISGFGTVQDVTDRKQMEEELRDLNETLERRVAERTATIEQRNHEMQQFAFIASHDLQEPLRKVQTFAALMREEYEGHVDDTARYYLERMQDAAARMSILLRDILSFSRITAQQNRFERLSIQQIVQEVITELDLRIEASSARVEFFDDVELEADPALLRQLLTNLVLNAIKFQPHGNQPHIQITATRESNVSGEDICRIITADNGIGFDSKYAGRIFEPFQRLHGNTEYTGTGMGLSICRRIVEWHGGTIRAESTPGEGSRFIVELPVRSSAHV